MDRWRVPILAVSAALGGLVIFLNRPPTTAGVLGVVVVLAVVFLAVELLRRPDPGPEAED